MKRAPGSYAGLTSKQADTLSLLRYAEMHGETPSFDELRERLGVAAKSNVHRLVVSLAERGYIERIPNRARSIRCLNGPGSTTERQAGFNLSDIPWDALIAEVRRRVPA